MFEASTATKKELRPNPPNSRIVDTVYAGNQPIFSGCSQEIVKVLASALPSEADIKLILVKGSANDPKRNSQLLRHLFYGMSLVYAYEAKQQIAATGEK